MNINFKRGLFWLLGIVFTSAIISDIIYGKSELASEYLIGQFIGQIFSMSMSFVIILCLLWFMLEFLFKDFFNCMFYSCDMDKAKLVNKKRRKKK